MRRKAANPQSFSEVDINEYLRTFSRPGALRAGLAWYRAAMLSAEQGSLADMAAPLRAFADKVSGVIVPHSGHFLPEEQPSAISRAFIAFFHDGSAG